MGKLNGIISDLSAYIMLNSCAYNSSGFYNGRSGSSLALFEASSILDDRFLESEAHEFLEESLLCKTEDISFRNGLSGIGFVLAYLIANGFVHADFDEIYGEQLDRIREQLESDLQNEDIYPFSHLEVCYFFSLLIHRFEKEELTNLRNRMLERADLQMQKKLQAHNTMVINTSRTTLTDCFKIYLSVRNDAAIVPPADVLSQYASLYQKGILVNDYTIGYYFSKIEPPPESGWNEIVIQNHHPFLLNSPFYVTPLNETINTLSLLLDDAEYSKNCCSWVDKTYLSLTSEALETELLSHIPLNTPLSEYAGGVSRFILFLCKVVYFREGIPANRFKSLFKP